MTLIAASPAMRRVAADIGAASGRRTHVLLSGEPGTGRELIARTIHAASLPSDAPFVVVDCAQAPSDLEAQLFATAGHRGPVERRSLERVRRQAQLVESIGGTLFLQNLPDLPARIQMRLARVLRDREAMIVDDGVRVELDQRVITAGEPSLDGAVLDGRVLPDLHRRLAEFRIDIPALRERREDIPDLATRLVAQSCEHAGLPVKQFSDAAMRVVMALPWRGNGDELQRFAELLVTRTAAPTISIDDVLTHVTLDGQAAWLPVSGTLREARARFEREYIAAVVARHHGSIPAAAKTLGIQRSNLYRKMRHLRVKPNARRSLRAS